MQTNCTSTLVGMHFRPPAKAVLAHLPSGIEITLRPEPDNPYDEYAIMVLISPEAIPESEYEDLTDDMADSGFDLDELLAESEFHLGYVGSKPGKAGPLPGITYAPDIAPVLSVAESYIAELAFDASGAPIIHMSITSE